MTAAALNTTTPASRGWIFSGATDALLFLLVPALVGFGSIGLMALGEAHWGWTWAGTLPYPLGFLLFVLIDLAHQYSTFFLIGFKDEYQRRRVFYWVAPAVICVALVGLNLLDTLYFVRFYAYYSAYHFVRQEYGWVMMAARKGGKPGDKIDAAAIYAVTLGPLLYMSSASDLPSWFVLGDLWLLPVWVGEVALACTAAACVLYPLHLARDWRAAFTGKLFAWLKSALIWGGALIVFQGSIWGVTVVVAHHGLPYLYLAARYVRSRRAVLQPTETPKGHWVHYFLASVWLLAAVHFVLESNAWDWISALQMPWLDRTVNALLYPILASIGVFHFVVDSFFWKIKYNPSLKVLSARPQTQARG